VSFVESSDRSKYIERREALRGILGDDKTCELARAGFHIIDHDEIVSLQVEKHVNLAEQLYAHDAQVRLWMAESFARSIAGANRLIGIKTFSGNYGTTYRGRIVLIANPMRERIDG
jgi:hypothetical protein